MEVRTARQAVQIARKLSLRKTREEEQRFIIEGSTFVEEALRRRRYGAAGVDCLIYTEKVLQHQIGRALLRQARERGVPAFPVDERVYWALSDTETPQGVLAVVQKPVWRSDELLQRPDGLFLALDRVQDPGNLGTILRTGDAAGTAGVWLGQGTVDAYNPKVLRAAMGSIFRLPAFSNADLTLLLPEMKAGGINIVAADPHAGQSYFKAELKHPRLLLLIGNEGRGINRDLLAMADQIVSIPLRPEVESLNAAVAAALLLYEVYRQRLTG